MALPITPDAGPIPPPDGGADAGVGATPKSPIGGPAGPGGSPMMSPGGGAGNRAAATQQIKAVMPALLMSAMAFESGSKEQQAILRAISSLNPIFGKAEGQNMVPAGIQAMAQASKAGGPPTTSPPPGAAAGGGGPPAGMPLPGAA